MINEEDYLILKGLDAEWNWIARDKVGALGCYMKKPKKYKVFLKLWTDNISPPRYIDDAKFQFIQWEDEEPYEIAELIEEYESEYHIKNVKLDASKISGNASDYKHFYKRLGESEETEVKDLKWFRKEILDNKFRGHTIHIDVLFELMDELDEPEVLSWEWVRENQERKGIHFYVNVSKLQNLLVPTLSKKVQLSQKTADELNRYKELGYSLKDLLVVAGSKQAQEKLARAWLDGYEVEEEPKYIIDLDDEEISDGNHYLKHLEVSIDGFRVLAGDPLSALLFERKEEAQLIAHYVGGRVKELEG